MYKTRFDLICTVMDFTLNNMFDLDDITHCRC